MEEIKPKKVIWLKVSLMLLVLTPIISCMFIAVYLWLHGVTFTK